MRQNERLDKIKQLLVKKHQISTKELASLFKVSFDTARRDVLRLTSTGQAIRIHGGIIELDHNKVPEFSARTQIQSPIKQKMAETALHFIHPGQCDFIAPSTTLQHLCTMLNGTDLQIVTNSLDCAFALTESPLPQVSILGGTLYKKDRFISSSAALKEINGIHFNTVFIGTSRIRPDGVYTASLADAEIVRAVVDQATQVILVAEKYKFTNHNSSPFKSTSLDKIDVVITDTELNKEYRQYFNTRTRIVPVLRKDNYD